MSPVDEEDDSLSQHRSSAHLRSHSSDEDLTQNLSGIECDETNIEDLSQEKTDSLGLEPASEPHMSTRFRNVGKKLSNLEIPEREKLFEILKGGNKAAESSCPAESPLDVYETADETFCTDGREYMIPKENLVEQNDEERSSEVETIPEESILKRINSHKGMKSYQLGKHLSFKWTTGAGPRIGCVRDYPCELQFRALEKVNLSPRSAARCRSDFSPRTTSVLSPTVSSAPTNCYGEMRAVGSRKPYTSVDQGNLTSSTIVRTSSCAPFFRLEKQASVAY